VSTSKGSRNPDLEKIDGADHGDFGRFLPTPWTILQRDVASGSLASSLRLTASPLQPLREMRHLSREILSSRKIEVHHLTSLPPVINLYVQVVKRRQGGQGVLG
jgi:hypothetical protein